MIDKLMAMAALTEQAETCTVRVCELAQVIIDESAKGPITLEQLGPTSPFGVALNVYATEYAKLVMLGAAARPLVTEKRPERPELN